MELNFFNHFSCFLRGEVIFGQENLFSETFGLSWFGFFYHVMRVCLGIVFPFREFDLELFSPLESLSWNCFSL